MTIIEDQYQKIIEIFPDVLLINELIFHIQIPLQNNVFLDIDFKNYPKIPIVNLKKANEKTFKNLKMMLSSLRTWKKKDPVDIIDVINEVQLLVKSMQMNEVLIKRELMQGILGLCKDQHPREILGMLRMEKGIISEFLLPPGALRSNNNALFNPSRIPLDNSIVGTVHSHPSGNPIPSGADINLFKRGHIHIIIGHPYDYFTIKCYDQNSNPFHFRLVD